MLFILTSTGDKLFLDSSTSMTLNKFEFTKKGFLVNFSQRTF